jgi:hypothetical protein
MVGDKTTAPRLRLVASAEPPSAEGRSGYAAMARAREEYRPSPLWIDLVAVLGICIAFWAGLALLIAAWA